METNLLLLSGGLDSSLCLELLLDTYAVIGVGFDYGQPHKVELKYAERYAKTKNIPYSIINIPYIPKIDDIVFSGRNAVLLSTAFSIAYSKHIKFVTIGVNKDDAELFSDCRKEFISGMALAAKAYNITLLTPLIDLTKKEVVEISKQYNLDYNATWTCYFPTLDNKPCSKCYACIGRSNAAN